jgi:hypothetical protein
MKREGTQVYGLNALLLGMLVATAGGCGRVRGLSSARDGGLGAGGSPGNSGGFPATGGAASGSGGSQGESGSSSGRAQTACPVSEPNDGDDCSTLGLACPGFGSLACPETARCRANGVWQIECPQTPFGLDSGICVCAHPIGNDGSASGPRVPANHRSSASICPALRGAMSPNPIGPGCTDPADGGFCRFYQCNQDSDCKEGANGRCGDFLPLPSLMCSYDACFGDADCPAGVPCDCRQSAASSDANRCLGGSSCRVDADCGFGGYCSPSKFGQWCGSYYCCHTPDDKCVDDSDCTGVGCNFDTKVGYWACGGDCGPPPP